MEGFLPAAPIFSLTRVSFSPSATFGRLEINRRSLVVFPPFFSCCCTSELVWRWVHHRCWGRVTAPSTSITLLTPPLWTDLLFSHIEEKVLHLLLTHVSSDPICSSVHQTREAGGVSTPLHRLGIAPGTNPNLGLLVQGPERPLKTSSRHELF